MWLLYQNESINFDDSNLRKKNWIININSYLFKYLVYTPHILLLLLWHKLIRVPVNIILISVWWIENSDFRDTPRV
jgi:hypothetical protein